MMVSLDPVVAVNRRVTSAARQGKELRVVCKQIQFCVLLQSIVTASGMSRA